MVRLVRDELLVRASKIIGVLVKVKDRLRRQRSGERRRGDEGWECAQELPSREGCRSLELPMAVQVRSQAVRV